MDPHPNRGVKRSRKKGKMQMSSSQPILRRSQREGVQSRYKSLSPSVRAVSDTPPSPVSSQGMNDKIVISINDYKTLVEKINIMEKTLLSYTNLTKVLEDKFKILEGNTENTAVERENETVLRNSDEVWITPSRFAREQSITKTLSKPLETSSRFAILEDEVVSDTNDVIEVDFDAQKSTLTSTGANKKQQKPPKKTKSVPKVKTARSKPQTSLENIPSPFGASPPTSHSNEYKLKALIIGDSHIKRISKDVIKFETEEKRMIFKNFDGAKTKYLQHHVLPFLHESLPETVVIHAGTNDLNENKLHITQPDELARSILDIGKVCKQFGVKNIGISAIVPQNDNDVCRVISETNELVKNMCDFNNFFFISNDNISQEFLCPDGTHLGDVGYRFLENNIIDYLKTKFH